VIYKGTSLSLWVLEAFVAFAVVAFVLWLMLSALVWLLLLAGIALAAFLLWWGWIEALDRLLDRRGPPTIS
jgi:hypothetical protein